MACDGIAGILSLPDQTLPCAEEPIAASAKRRPGEAAPKAKRKREGQSGVAARKGAPRQSSRALDVATGVEAANLRELMALGYSESAAQDALDASGGILEHAVEHLLTGYA